MLPTLYKFKRLIAFVLVTVFCFSNTSMAVFAAEITKYDKLPTDTNIVKDADKAIWDITTNTTKNGTGFNTFSKFNVDKGDIVNLKLNESQNKLINLVFDTKASQINGIVNSYKDGKIGGHILFANPNGFVIGKDGVFNVGSLMLLTPTQDYMEKLLNEGANFVTVNEDRLNSLISFKMNNDVYTFKSKNSEITLMPSPITIEGKINSGGGIDIYNGGQTIDIKQGAEINANMDFTVSGTTVTATPKENVVPTPIGENNTYEIAMNGGNAISINSVNSAQDRDYLSAIVNVDGKIRANGGAVCIETDISKIDKEENVSTSLINIKSNADIDGYDVRFTAKATADGLDNDVLDVGGASTWLNILQPEEWINAVISDFVHLGNLKSIVTVENGAKINASRNMDLISLSYMPNISAWSVSETFALGYMEFNCETETRVKSGANLTAGNDLTVRAVTDFNMSKNTRATSVAEVIDVKHNFGKYGAYVLSLSLVDIVNRAIIEQGANLDIKNNINVVASSVRDFTSYTANYMLPIVDRNRGSGGLGIGIDVISSTNEAIMYADAAIGGNLTVVADYVGKIASTTYAASYEAGEDGDFGLPGRIAQAIFKADFMQNYVFPTLNTAKAARADALFNKIAITAVLGFSIDDAKNYAYIGDIDKGIKPTISAKRVTVGATLKDNESFTYSETETDNAKDSAAGSIALNIKNLDSDAKVYADLTLSGDTETGEGYTPQALLVYSKTDVQHSLGYVDWVKNSLEAVKYWLGLVDKAKEEADVEKVDTSTVDGYLAQYGLNDNLQHEIDEIGSMFDIFNVIDFNTLGLQGTFNTFATSQANAATNEGKTNAWAGAVAIAVFNTGSNAELVRNSTVNLTGSDPTKNNILIQADTISEMWIGAALMSAFNYDKFFAGQSARDGDAAGGTFSVQVCDIDTTSKIGEGVKIKTSGSGKAGDLSVVSTENGEFVNVGDGTSSADKAGLGFDIAVTVLAGGETKAYIDKDAEVMAKNLMIKANKDDVMVHGLIAFVNSENSKSFGISTLGMGDTVEAYILGTVNAEEDVTVEAEYDKIMVNAIVNGGNAKTGDPVQGEQMNEPGDDHSVGLLEDFFEEDGIELSDLASSLSDEDALSNLGNNEYLNPNRGTSAYAGNVLLNVANSTVKAYIADGAKVNAGHDVKVNAKSNDTNVQVATIFSKNGKSGGGASVTFDLNKNDVEAYIGKAEVDAKNDISLDASEDYMLVGVSAGIGQAKDSTGVGVVSLDIQKNNVSAYIKDGAKINTNIDSPGKSVSVNADVTNKIIKAIGGLSIQSGGEANDGGAKGAAVDGDVALNSVKAYIGGKDGSQEPAQGVTLNVSDKLGVTASQKTTLVDVSVSGAVSTNESAYDGTVGIYASSGNTDAYISETTVNQTTVTDGTGVVTTISADNTYDNIAVTGTVAGASSTAAGGSFRIDWIDDNINSYIEKSTLNTTGALSMINKSLLDTVAITVAGQGSSSKNAYGGSIAITVDDTVQKNSIDDSTVDAGSMTFLSDSKYKTVGVTGAVTPSTEGNAVGGSFYLAVSNNAIDTFMTNSTVVSKGDIGMSSDYNLNNISIIFAGSGGKGTAGSGAIDTIVNNLNSNTYIADKKEEGKTYTHNATSVKSTDGKITIKGTDITNIRTINGSIAVSLSSEAIGAAINTVVDNTNLLAYLDSATVTGKGDVDISTKSEESIMSISIGGAGGDGIAAAGSINTMVIASDVFSYIKNSVVTSDGDIKITSTGDSKITGGTGAVNISASSLSLGLSVVTGVINNAIKSYIENSKADAKGDVSLSATANESIGTSTTPFITVAGGFSQGLTADGVVDTMVMNSTAKSEVKGTKTIDNVAYGISADGDFKLSATGTDTFYAVGGAVGGSTEIGVGLTVNTIVVDKDTIANAENTKITAKKISATSTETDNFFTTVVAAGGAGTGGVAGIVNTNVITSDVKSTFKNSALTTTNGATEEKDIEIKSVATANMQTISGAIAGGGSAGVGLSAVNDVINYTLEASADTVIAKFNNLKVDARTDNVYSFSTVSGAGAGEVAITGVENVNYINNSVKAFATGDLTGDSAEIKAKDKVTFSDSYSGTVAGAATAGIGATVEVNEVTSTVLAYIGGSNLNVKDITIAANGEQNFNGIFVAGFEGSGFVSGSGTILVNTIEATVKAYVTDNSVIKSIDNTDPEHPVEGPINSISLTAQNDMTLTEYTGAIAIGLGGGGIGATVATNSIRNTVEAYTGNNVNINAKDVTISAASNNNFGTSSSPLVAVAGAGGLYAGIAGTVFYTRVEDTVAAYVGESNTITLADSGKLDISADDTTNIYTLVGSMGIGAVGVGASVGYTVVENTVLAFIGSSSNIDAANADILISANSNETATSNGLVVAGGLGSLAGGVLYNSFGKQVGNASYNELSDKDKENFNAAGTQSSESVTKGNDKTTGADNTYKTYYNDLLQKVKDNKNTKDSRVRNITPKTDEDSLYTLAEGSGSSLPETKRDGTTSAYVDTSVTIKANSLTINAQNTDKVNLQMTGAEGSAIGVGISAAISDEQTTTNAFIQNNANIDVNSFTLSANSTDTQTIDTAAGAGGVIEGSGSISYAVSNKTTNAYVNRETSIKSAGDLLINTVSNSNLTANAFAFAAGGLVVGVSSAKTYSQGFTKIDLGDSVSLTSANGQISITSTTTDNSTADAEAATGSLVGGTGAQTVAVTGKDSSINIGSNFSASAKGDLNITSNSINNSTATSNGRAYGGVSVGGTSTTAEVNQTSGVKIAAATSAKDISAANVNISSNANNNANASTEAGAGAIIGISGSGVYDNITSNNEVSVGKNYNITTGKYEVIADTISVYKGFIDSSSYGVVAETIPVMENTVNSTVSATSNSNIKSDTLITVKAANELDKNGVDNYDLYGGAGGLDSGQGGYIKDNHTMTTSANFGGDYAYANGKYGEGSIDISAYNIANINEKADLYSQGGISGAGTDSKVNISTTATTTISNSDIKNLSDHINYVARNDVDIYTKCNVESYGGVAMADGNSSAIATAVKAEVIFEDTVKSTSGRDTNISAVSNKSLEAYMYARTRGLIGTLGDEANAKSKNSVAKVTIKGNGQDDETSGNAVIAAYDSINITAQNTSDKIKAKRDSKAYEIWCIPVTGTGNENTENTKSGEIIVNGILKSGLGFNKSLTIDMDGTLHKNGIDAEETEVGKISTADIDVDIELYKQSKKNATDDYNECTKVEQDQIKGYEADIANQESQINTCNSNIENNNNLIDGYYEEYTDISTGEDIVAPYLTAARAYWADVTNETKKTDYENARTTMDSKAEGLSPSIKSIITNIEAKSDSITEDCVKIVQCNEAIATAEGQIDIIRDSIKDITAKYVMQMMVLEQKIHELEEAKQSGQEITVYSIVVDDVIIRNGEINFYGDGEHVTYVNGDGYLKTPGDNASITVLNNSVSNLVFNKLSINGDLKGGVNFIDSTKGDDLHLEKGPDATSIIKITNTVDKNDPNVNIDTDSHAGDIVLKGIVENPFGTVEITNYTGNVISEGGITAKDLHIRVPNGSYEQQYTNTEQKIGGSDGTGAIVASGDILIEARTIDINGLIKSGTEIKEVSIPYFTVKKEGDKYYQINGFGPDIEMTESSVEAGFYYLTLTDDTSDLATLRQIRAYFKPKDPLATGNNIEGDIYLFKANTTGGNITLKGNIVNSSGTGGEIELLNGYGHINVVNNSDHNLVVSALNADTITSGVLTIYDFKVSSATDNTFDNLTTNDLKLNPLSDFLIAHSGEYTAKVLPQNDGGTISIKPTEKYITDGNGSWSGVTSTSITADGATMYSTTYTPGDDAYVITSAEKSGSYQQYVKRSWWTEFWYGKKFETVYYHQDPTYEVRQNPISVSFVGFDKPEINITSNGTGDVIMNNNISAMYGDVNIKSMGNILTKSVSYSISGKNITLQAGEGENLKNIGENVSDIAIRPIQVVVYQDGLVTATGEDVYLNYPKTDICNIVLNANDYAYLATDVGIMDLKGMTKAILNANELDLRADSININPSDLSEGVCAISVANWSARAKDDIYIENIGNISNPDLTVKYIASANNKDITIISRNGAIKAGETETYSNYNIIGGNVKLISYEAGIGEADKPIRIAKEGIYYIQANGDIYLDSGSKMHIDRISSTEGSVNLTAKFGIIASQITTDIDGKAVVYNNDGTITYKDGSGVVPHNKIRLYNISSDDAINLMTETGNIENIFVDTNGVINAQAGYIGDDIADATSDIHITLMSKKPTDDELNELKNNEITFEEFSAGYKDMSLGVIKTTKNVTLSGEKGVYEANENSYIKGDSITINAMGDVGTVTSKMELIPSREVAVYTRAGNNVYLENQNDLKVNKIDVTGGETESAYAQDQPTSIDKVVIISQGNITNSGKTQNIEESQIYYDKDGNLVYEPVVGGFSVKVNKLKPENQIYPNIRAEYISLTSGENIGDFNTELVVHTTSGDYVNNGLQYSADKKTYIKGIGDTLNILSGNSNDNVYITSTDTINIIANNITTTGNVQIESKNDIYAKDIIADNNDHNRSIQIRGTGVNIDGATAKQIDTLSNNITVSGNITTDKISISSATTTIEDAYIVELDNPEDYILNINSLSDTTIKDSTIIGNANILARKDTYGADANLYVENYTNIGNVEMFVDDNTEITNMLVVGDLENQSSNFKVTGTLEVTGSSNIITEDDIIINKIVSGTLTTDSENADITTLITNGNTSITTSDDTKIKNGTVGGNFTNTSKNTTIASKLNVTGDATITTVKNILINEINAKTLTTNSKNANIAEFSTRGDTIITTSEDTIIGKGTVGGKYTNISDNTTVTSKLDVKKDANIMAKDNVVISDGHMEQDLNVVAQNLLIKDIKLEGNIYADANRVNINTSNDLNIGYILSNGNIYTDSVLISSAKNITNGSGADATIIYAKDIDLKAGSSIGRIDKMINIGLHKDNSISVEAGKSVNINSTGAKANYTKLVGNDANIIADKSVKVRNMDVNYIELKTKSYNTDIKGKVHNKGNIRTKDKRIAINNMNFAPDYWATVQLYTKNETFHLKTDASNNVGIDSKFVVRHNPDIVINGFDFNSSMESEAIKAGETNRKNSDKKKDTIEEADDSLYKIEKLSDDSIIIRTIHGEIVTPENVYDVINPGDSLSEKYRKFKKKAKATIYDKISCLH